MRTVPARLSRFLVATALLVVPVLGAVPASAAATPAASPASTSAASRVAFVAAAHSDPEWASSKSVTVPFAAHDGDTAVLLFTHSSDSTWSGPSGVSGWTQTDTVTATDLTSTVWVKSLTAGDPGNAVTFETGLRSRHATLTVAVYSGVDQSRPVRAFSSSDETAGTGHATPSVDTSNEVVLSYWVDRDPADNLPSWTAPAGSVTRDVAEGAGIYRYDALLADSNGPVPDGSYPGQVATTSTDVAALNWSVVLPATAATSPAPTPGTSKLMVIMEENKTVAVLDQMPYLRRLGDTYGKATDYNGLVHPSLGNYFAIVSGQGTDTCGLGDPLPAGCPQTGTTVFDQALNAGRTAKTYAESMPSNCQSSNSPLYAARHNPWTYFTGQGDACAKADVPLGDTTQGQLVGDVRTGSLPDVSMVIPNLVHDTHDAPAGQADAWLSQWMPVLMSGPDYTSGRLTIVVTFDEGEGNDQNVPFVVVNPSLSGVVVQSRFDHFGLARWYDDVLGVAPLNAAASEPGLRAAFGL